MGDIYLSDIFFAESNLSVVDNSTSLFKPKKTLCLCIANGRERKPTPWYHGIEFDSLDEWFRFVRLVNRENRRVKRAKRDVGGFPEFEEERR